MPDYSEYKGLELPKSNERYNVAVFNKNNMVIDSELHKLEMKNESQDDLLATKEALAFEAARAADREAGIAQNLHDEMLRAKSAEADIAGDLADETDRAAAAEASISDSLSALISDFAAEFNAALHNKADKISGKDLSANDYTTAEKDKLAGIASGAEVNVQPDWNDTDAESDAFIKNKPAIPTKLSQLTNDSGYKTTDTTYGVVSTSANGLCPKRTGTTTKFLRDDGTWAVPAGNGGIDYSDSEPAQLVKDMTWIGN